jgi:hypothetical protein
MGFYNTIRIARFPQAAEYPIRAVSNFFENSRKY